MTYEYKSHIYLAETVLNVKDLASQTAFYQQVIGLEILSQTETESILGLGGKVLVQLIQAQESGEPQLFTPNLKTIQNPCLSLDPGWFLFSPNGCF
ncbi:VOC family protein, partial [Streptococcus pneumoniae]|nr:VOC family protein [Streptococcus pneumoniae]